jgi:hypothetical protein
VGCLYGALQLGLPFQGLREGKNACQGNKETPVALVPKATSMEGKKPEHRLLHGITATNSWSTVKRFAASVPDEMVAAAPEAYVRR